MSEKQDFIKALEAILGFEPSEEAVQRIQLKAVASYTQSNLPGEAFSTRKSQIAAFPPKRCDPAHLMDVSGSGITGNDGRSIFRLTDFVCFNGPFAPPVNVIATPLSAKPFFLTVLQSFVKDDDGNLVDVEIQVHTWQDNGAPASDIPFNWRCRVEIPNLIF